MNFIKVPAELIYLFPIRIDNLRIELTEDEDGDFYVSEGCLEWAEFNSKLEGDQSKQEPLVALYTALELAERVEITIKVTEEEI